MNRRTRAFAAGAAGAVALALVSVTLTPAAALVTSGVTALYEMNEPVGTTVMTDSSGNGNDGVVDPTGVESGGVYDGETAYNSVFRLPTEPPPAGAGGPGAR